MANKLDKKIAIIEDIFPSELFKEFDIHKVDQVYNSEYSNKYNQLGFTSIIKVETLYKEHKISIVLYHGIGYRSNEYIDNLIVASVDDNEATLMDEALYYKKQKPSTPIIDALYAELYSFYFDGDADQEGICYENPYFIEETAEKLEISEFVLVEMRIPREKPELNSLKDLGEKYFALASGNLYFVSVVAYNEIKFFKANLKKEEADELYVLKANEWLQNDKPFDTIEDVEKYLESSAEENCDDIDCQVSIEPM